MFETAGCSVDKMLTLSAAVVAVVDLIQQPKPSSVTQCLTALSPPETDSSTITSPQQQQQHHHHLSRDP